MKKITILILLFAACALSLSAQVTQLQADSIALDRMSSDQRAYTLYAKQDLQDEGYTITTSQGEVFELDYPCWVYYVTYTNEIATKYLVVKESNGSLLEINVRNDEGPDDLSEWETLFTVPQIDFAPIGAEWYYHHSGAGLDCHPHHVVSERDTIINGYRCRIVKQYIPFQHEMTDEHIIRQERGKVYFYHLNRFHLMLDFDAQIGDTVRLMVMYLHMYQVNGEFFFIDSICPFEYRVENIVNNSHYHGLRTFLLKPLVYPYTNPMDDDSPYLTYSEKVGFYREFMIDLYDFDTSEGRRSFRCYSDHEINVMSTWWQSQSLPCDYQR